MAKQILGKVLITFKGEYESATLYKQLDVVTYQGSSYIAKKDSQGNLPTNTTYFALLVQKPIKGVDYLTQAEIEDIVEDIISDSTNAFNQNVTAKTTEFNTNATNKTSAFNDNYDSKVSSFNSNATSKVNDFNSNYSDKVSSFNSHVNDKKDEIDTYVGTKETTFDSHVSGKIDDFDSNATSKTTAFNTNATSKTNDFNSNASAKTTEFNNNAVNIERELDKYKTIYNVLPKVENDTLSSEVELDGTGEAYMKIKPIGKVSQESTTGRNKLLYTLDVLKTLNTGGSWNNNVYTFNGVTYTVNDNLSVTVNGTATETSTLIINNSLNLEDGTEYKLNGCPSGGAYNTYSLRMYDGSSYDSQTGTDLTFTYSTQNLVRINIFGGITINNLIFKSMIRLATETDDTYEPYTGGQPAPNLDCPQSIKVVTGNNNVKVQNKNLFDVSSRSDTQYGVTYSFDGSEFIINGTRNGSTYLFNNISLGIFEAGTYTFSFNRRGLINSTAGEEFSITDGTNNIISTSLNKDNYSNTITLSSETELKIRYWLQNGVSYNNYILGFQLEKGTTATSYIAHKEQNLSLNIGNLEMYEGDYFFKNEIDSENYDSNLDLNAWYLKNNYDKVILDGSENWTLESSTDVRTALSTNISDIEGYTDGASIPNLLSSRFIPVPYDATWQSGNISRITNSQSQQKIVLLYEPNTTVADFKSWLSTNNTEVVYPLATPTYTKITDTTLISQLETINNANSYQEKTYITCTSSSADNEVLQVKAVALKDIQAMFDETNNAILEIGGE